MLNKINAIVLLMLVGLIVQPVTVFAHTGKTDSHGCHNNKKTGEYHCHGNFDSIKIAKAKSRVEVKKVVICEANIYNCSDFSGRREAQSIYDFCFKEIKKDIHDLDRDGDGLVCE